MNAVFADTFYWIALTAPLDAAHGQAKRFTGYIVTTEEVLIEYLNFFCATPEHFRRRVVAAVEAILQNAAVRIIPQSHSSFRSGLDLFHAAPTRGTASPIASRCRPCAGRGWSTSSLTTGISSRRVSELYYGSPDTPPFLAEQVACGSA